MTYRTNNTIPAKAATRSARPLFIFTTPIFT
jgi:hypothetical protein